MVNRPNTSGFIALGGGGLLNGSLEYVYQGLNIETDFWPSTNVFNSCISHFTGAYSPLSIHVSHAFKNAE